MKTRVTVWHERELRRKALSNSKMAYLNVQLTGLSGHPHPVLHNITNTQEAKKLRVHLKFLTSDYLTNERRAKDNPALSSACVLCSDPLDSIEHVMVTCRATSEVTRRIYPELVNAISQVQPTCRILQFHPSPSILTQFLLDPTSMNLPDSIRVPSHNPGVSIICKISRDWCFSVSNERSRQVKLLRK